MAWRPKSPTPDARSAALRELRLPAFGYLPCLIGEDPPALDIGWVIDTAWLAQKVSPLLQQRSGISCGGLHSTCRPRDMLLQQFRAVLGLRRPLQDVRRKPPGRIGSVTGPRPVSR